MFDSLAQNLAALAEKIPFDALMWLCWGSFGVIFILAVTLTLALPNVRCASKRPFLCLVYVYTALTLALFLTVSAFEDALFIACIFWIAGYLLYGVLCAMTKERSHSAPPAQVAAAAAPVIVQASPVPPHVSPQPQSRTPVKQPAQSFAGGIARNNVRLEHALSVTNRLLEKNLGKTDRQELEKLKNTLEVLKVKGALSPAEGEILNENFNTLLKLMAKYNV